MEGSGRWMVIRRTSGKTVELSTVWVGRNAKPRKARRKGSSTAQKMDENERDTVKRLARIFNCNYRYGDLLLTPKYDDAGYAKLEEWARENIREGESWGDALLRAAERQGQLYLERVKYELKKQGVKCKYVLATSDMDGETGEPVRPHHHLVIPRVSFEWAAKKWEFGTVDYQVLKDQEDYTAMAIYICKQVRHRPDAKKWTCSRNLKRPIVSTHWAKPGEELRPDRGTVLVDRNQWEPGKPQYIRFVKRPLPSERQKQAREAERTFSHDAGRDVRGAADGSSPGGGERP